MDQTTELLLRKDPHAFLDVVRNDDPEVRVRTLTAFDDLMTCEILRHGIFRSESELPSLAALYNEYFLPAPLDRRKEVFEHVKGLVTVLGGDVACAFNPFMLLDEDVGIVSTATIDYCSFSPLIDGDPMSRPQDVVTMIRKAIPRNPAAAFGGLLALGDPRVCKLILPLREHLDVNQVQIVSNCHSGLTYKCNVEFYLDWLEEFVDRVDQEGLAMFGHIAAGLYRLSNSRVPNILDGQRPFPFRSDDTSQFFIDRQDFASSISARLYALEEQENAPKLMPHLIRLFGMTPRTVPNDTFKINMN
ncbi:MAG: hypothetical protein WC889_01555 [Myxococcota bacterium]|jgi:hypothetical protein